MENSKLQMLYDFKQLKVPEKLFEIPLKESQVEHEMAEVPERFLTIEEVTDEVKTRDIITIVLPKTEEFEEEFLQINVEKKFYDGAWEETLLGKKLDDVIILPERGFKRVGKLLQIKRRVCPPLTDALIPPMGIEGVNTLTDYRKYMEEKLVSRKKHEKQSALLNYVIKELINQSEFADLSSDIDKRLGELKKQYENMAEQKGVTYEEILDKYTPDNLSSLEQKEKYLEDQQLQDIKLILIAQYFIEQNGVELNHTTYEEAKKMYLEQGINPSFIEEQFPYEVYLMQAKVSCLQEYIAAFYNDKFMVVKV